ncbi:hypothetical protein [Gimesia sp.]|uniref:hypothetical protein n=1 Tax=Gimesia sp. TaxID=2024833 RepID=UPI0032EB8D32
MNEQDYNNVLDLMRKPFPCVAEAMEERFRQTASFGDKYSPYSFAVASTKLQPKVYDLLRATDWFLAAVPDNYFGEGMLRASVMRKEFVPRPQLCFHSTPAKNQKSVEKHGLLPEISVDGEGRSKMFADSPYYIYASLSEQEARGWCERFKEEEFLIYPVHSGVAGINLFIDPCSVDTDRQIVSGYILDTIRVLPDFLGEAISA